MSVADSAELVLCVPTAALLDGLPLQGARAVGAGRAGAPGAEAWLRRIFAAGVSGPAPSRFLARAAAEEDPAWKQIIGYVVLRHVGGEGETILSYRRGARGGEKRLTALRSIGLGGHINPRDESLFAAPGWEAYRAAVARELAEEVGLAEDNVLRRRLVGVLNDDSTPVGRVHFGLIHIWDLARPEIGRRESKITAPRFQPPRELLAPLAPAAPDAGGVEAAAELESWSALCLAAWEQLRAAPDWSPPTGPG